MTGEGETGEGGGGKQEDRRRGSGLFLKSNNPNLKGGE